MPWKSSIEVKLIWYTESLESCKNFWVLNGCPIYPIGPEGEARFKFRALSAPTNFSGDLFNMKFAVEARRPIHPLFDGKSRLVVRPLLAEGPNEISTGGVQGSLVQIQSLRPLG
jgi:hypothetical protein